MTTHDDLVRSLIVERYSRRPKFTPDPDTADRQAQRRKELAEALGITDNTDRPALRVVKGRAA